MVGNRFPSPVNSVRFAGGPLKGMDAEGCCPALHAGRLGALPSISTTLVPVERSASWYDAPSGFDSRSQLYARSVSSAARSASNREGTARIRQRALQAAKMLWPHAALPTRSGEFDSR
jgi:hypothetical protein